MATASDVIIVGGGPAGYVCAIRSVQLGMATTLVERDRHGSHAVLTEIWSSFPDALETIVPRTEAFARASTLGVPVGFLGGETGQPEARRFDLLADEIEGRMNRLDGMEKPREAQPARQLL